MRQSLLLLSLSLPLLFTTTPAHTAMPAHDWSKRFGANNTDIGYAIAVDSAGSIYVTGGYQNVQSFGGTPLLYTGGTDAFLAKFDAVGFHMWSRRFGGTNAGGTNDAGRALAVGPSGSGFLTGFCQGTADLGCSPVPGAGQADIFLNVFDASTGAGCGGSFGSPFVDMGLCVAIDPFGDLLFGGTFSGTVNFGGGGLTSNGVGTDIVLAKYDGDTTAHLWSRRFGSTNIEQATALATDAAGNVFMTGTFSGATDFGGGPLAYAGASDMFLAKFDPAGIHLWSLGFGSTGSDFANGIAVDDQGNVFLTGYFNGTVSFGGTNLVSTGSGDIVLAKYNGNGAHQWSYRFGGTLMDSGNSVAIDASNNVVLTGYFANTANFGGVDLVSVGSNDIFFASFNPLGVHQWSERFGGTGDDQGLSLAVDAGDNLVATGAFSGTVNFGGSDLTSVTSNSFDIFLVRFGNSAALPLVTSITDIPNDQGRQLKIRFAPSPLDVVSSFTPITLYEVYRRDDAPPATASRNPVGLSQRELLVDGWTFVGWAPAHNEVSYGIDVPTIGDSTSVAGPYHSVFFVRAATSQPNVFFDSPLDSGQSVDNLAPGVPSGLLYSTGNLTWNDSPAADFDYFTVYGASSNDFGTATSVGYTVTPEMDVAASPHAFFFVTATDFSGNESNPAMIPVATGVDGTPRAHVLSINNYPNPFNPQTTLSYTLPSRGPVTLTIYDASGALVATLVDNEERDAGGHHTEWNGRTNAGAPATSGVYFARIELAGASRTKKMVLLK